MSSLLVILIPPELHQNSPEKKKNSYTYIYIYIFVHIYIIYKGINFKEFAQVIVGPGMSEMSRAGPLGWKLKKS